MGYQARAVTSCLVMPSKDVSLLCARLNSRFLATIKILGLLIWRHMRLWARFLRHTAPSIMQLSSGFPTPGTFLTCVVCLLSKARQIDSVARACHMLCFHAHPDKCTQRPSWRGLGALQ